jgi:type I restriction enzyme S subunit
MSVTTKQVKAGLRADDLASVPPGFEWSEIGVIPKDWGVVPLSRISDFITKGSTPTTYGFKWQETGVLFLRSECVAETGLDLAQAMYISPAANEALRRSIVRDADILITITGYVGRVVTLVDVGTANINQHIARIRISAPGVLPRYVYYFLSQNKVRQKFESITTGQAYPQISLYQVREAKVALPPHPEQRAITQVLADVDDLLVALDKLIAKKRAIKQAAMQQLVTGKTHLRGFSGNRVEKPLGTLATVTMGQSPPSKSYNQRGDGLPLIQGNADLNERRSIARVWTIQASKRCNAGDLLLTVRAPVGAVGIATTDSCLGRGVCGLRPVRNKAFLFQALVFAEPRWKILEQGSTFTSANSRQVREFILSVPEDEREEEAVAVVLSEMDSEIAALEQRWNKTRAIRQGMMQQLLTGRMRLERLAHVETGA